MWYLNLVARFGLCRRVPRKQRLSEKCDKTTSPAWASKGTADVYEGDEKHMYSRGDCTGFSAENRFVTGDVNEGDEKHMYSR